MGSYETRALFNAIRGLSVVLEDIRISGELDSASRVDIEFVSSQLIILLVELESRAEFLSE